MRERDWKPERDSLYRRYSRIVDDRAPGAPEPVLWAAALRQVPWAMTELARLADQGRLAGRVDAAAIERRAWRLGDSTAAFNRAMDAFNRRDLTGYRRWLARAARAGDAEAGLELRRFETRLPHADAPPGHRRPYRRSER